MFIIIVLATLGAIIWLVLRDWTVYLRLSPKRKKRILKNVSELLVLEKWEEAEKELRPLLNKDVQDRQTLLLYVRVLRGTKELEKALECVEKAARRYPEELLFRIEEGKILIELNRGDEALAAFQVAAPILREEADLLAFGRTYLQAGEAKRCWEVIEPLFHLTQSVAVFLLAGTCLMELGRPKEALDLFDKALKKGGETHQLLTLMASAYRKEKNFDAAEEVFRKILRKDPGDVLATLGFCACIQERGHHLRALIFLQASNAWIKGDTRLYYQAGILSLLLSKFDIAADSFQKVREKGEISPQLLRFYAYSLEGLGKWGEAEKIYLLMVELFPHDPSAYLALAWLFGIGFSSQITAAEGLEFAEKALGFSSDKISWETLSACEARQGNYSRAIQIQEYLISLDEEKPDRLRRQRCLSKLRKQLPLDDPALLLHHKNRLF